jgi:hypothetical protein
MSLQYSNSVDLLTLDSSDASEGVTETTTGEAFDVSQRSQLTIQFVCADHTNGGGTFRIDGSNDGTNWVVLALEDSLTTTPATRVISSSLILDSSKGYYIPAGWRYVRAHVQVDVDGTYFAHLHCAG